MSKEEQNEQEQELNKDSGVEGIETDDWYKGLPVFDVEQESFFKNMRQDRNRMRFPNGHKVSQFMQGTKYRKPFYIRHVDSNNQNFLKKIK